MDRECSTSLKQLLTEENIDDDNKRIMRLRAITTEKKKISKMPSGITLSAPAALHVVVVVALCVARSSIKLFFALYSPFLISICQLHQVRVKSVKLYILYTIRFFWLIYFHDDCTYMKTAGTQTRKSSVCVFISFVRCYIQKKSCAQQNAILHFFFLLYYISPLYIYI